LKILLVHKFFHMTGGTEQYFRNLAAILEQRGHQTIPFALEHPNNPKTPYAKYFLENLDYRERSRTYAARNIFRILARTVYSWEARAKIEALIGDTAPDVAHVQSIEHHISPSVLHSLRKYNVPIVQSVNHYKLVCASYRLFIDREGVCERCLYGKHYHVALTRCVKDSLPASVLATLEMYVHGWLKIYHLVDRFIVSSRFMETRLLEAGYPACKLVRLLNPLDLTEYTPSYDFGDYILYFGRLDPEKGVMTLVQAMAQIPEIKLIIVGDGSQLEMIRNWVKDSGIDNIELVGPKWGEELKPYLAMARLVVVPSVWYEPSPMVIYQAFATGKPVIGSNTGGIPDLLTDETGLLFEAGNVEDLVIKIVSLAFDDERLHSMGRAARRWAEVNLDPDCYYDTIMQLYAEVIEEKSR